MDFQVDTRNRWRYHLRMNTSTMNDIQGLIAELRGRGWTLSAIADELGVSRQAVERWREGTRYPHQVVAVKALLERMLRQRRVPKRKRYMKRPLAQQDQGL